MPLVNVIHGDRIPTSALNIRMPVWRPPLSLLVPYWTARTLLRLIIAACRFYWLSGPIASALYLWAVYGWPIATAVTAATAAGLVAWWRWHRPSFSLILGRTYTAKWRGWYLYGRRWAPAMACSGLAVAFDGVKYVPRIMRVRTTAYGDEVTVRMLPGQTPDQWAKAAPALAHTFRVRDARIHVGKRPDTVVLVFRRTEPLTKVVAPLPVPMVPNLKRLAVGVRESGEVYHLALAPHLLVVGATDAGKGSVLWSIVNALAGGIASGTVRVIGIDPKEGMELAAGSRMFWRFVYGSAEEMADTLEELVQIMRERAGRLRGITRQHVATADDPTYVCIIDELGSLTAYGADRKTRDRIKDALGLLLSKGRAVGVHIVAALQDPRKEVLSIRDLFPLRIALRVAESSHVDMVLGEGAYDRGAHAELIPKLLPGVAYVIEEKHPAPVMVRFSNHTDSDLADLSTRYGRLHAVTTDSEAGRAA